MLTVSLPVSNMLNKLHGQPETYDKKYVSITTIVRLGLITTDRNINLAERLAQGPTAL
jgi:hypothetical protein